MPCHWILNSWRDIRRKCISTLLVSIFLRILPVKDQLTQTGSSPHYIEQGKQHGASILGTKYWRFLRDKRLFPCRISWPIVHSDCSAVSFFKGMDISDKCKIFVKWNKLYYRQNYSPGMSCSLFCDKRVVFLMKQKTMISSFQLSFLLCLWNGFPFLEIKGSFIFFFILMLVFSITQ